MNEEFMFPYNGIDYTFCKAGKNDIPAIAKLYRQIAVTKDNYRDRFCEESKDSFARHGGMFYIQTEETLPEAMEEAPFYLLKEGDEVISSLWAADSDPDFSDFTMDMIDKLEPQRQVQLQNDLEENKVVYSREFIVSNYARLPKTSLVMLFLLYRKMLQSGKSCSLVAIYRLIAWSDEQEKLHEINIFNERSYSMSIFCGGERIGQLPEIKKIVPPYQVVIRPQIIIFNFELVVKKLGDYLGGYGFSFVNQ